MKALRAIKPLSCASRPEKKESSLSIKMPSPSLCSLVSKAAVSWQKLLLTCQKQAAWQTPAQEFVCLFACVCVCCGAVSLVFVLSYEYINCHLSIIHSDERHRVADTYRDRSNVAAQYISQYSIVSSISACFCFKRPFHFKPTYLVWNQINTSGCQRWTSTTHSRLLQNLPSSYELKISSINSVFKGQYTNWCSSSGIHGSILPLLPRIHCVRLFTAWSLECPASTSRVSAGGLIYHS